MKRILLFNFSLAAGGAERQLMQLAKHWSEMGFIVRVLLLEKKGVWINELPANIRVCSLSKKAPSRPLIKILWILCLVLRLRRFLCKHQFDVVLTFLWLPTLISTLAIRGLKHRPLLVWSVQSDLEREFEMYKDGFLRKKLVQYFLPSQVDHFIAISQGIKSKAQRLLNLSDECFTVIPNSIAFSYIRSAEGKCTNVIHKKRNIRLVSVGRLHYAKGMDLLLQAITLIFRSGAKLECYIIGEGSEQQKLNQLSKELVLNDSVRFVGYSSVPYAWLHTADIFVSASRWEAFGIAIIEAMALGLPVVATETDGAKDIIDNGVDGLIVPVEDPQRLAEAVLKLLRDPTLRQRLGVQAKLKAKQFDSSLIVQRYTGLLERLLNGMDPKL